MESDLLKKQIRSFKTTTPPPEERIDRYKYTHIISVYGLPDVYGLYRKLEFSDKEPLNYYRVTEQDLNRLDIISEKFYNTPKYWWLIALTNDIIDPFYVPTDMTLKIYQVSDFIMGGTNISG